MRELSLFSGAGGGLLGTHLLGWRPVGYVEIDDYCQRVIAARIRDGILPDAPIFGDIRTFICDGYAASYTGMVDVITAGFPCQPFSLAGRRQGEMDARNMWPDTLRVIRIVQPTWVVLENVSGLVAVPYFGQILADLATSGFDAKSAVISAAELGADHKRARAWIVANAQFPRLERLELERDTQEKQPGPARVPVAKIWEEAERPALRVDVEFPRPVDRIRALGNAQIPGMVREAWRRLTT